MRQNVKLVPAFAILLVLSGCGFLNRVTQQRQYLTPHVEGASLMVHSRNGSIEVQARPELQEVIIDVWLTCSGITTEEAQTRVDATTVIVERDSSGMLQIRPEFPGGERSGDGAKFVIQIPDARGVNLTTGNGKVIATGLSGVLVIDTSNGSVTIENHDGQTQVHTSNGRISLVNQGGPVEARTSNGSITMSLQPGVTGPFALDSSNGSITVEVGETFTGRVTFDTSNGGIHIRGDEKNIIRERIRRSEGFIVIGSEDGPESTIDTSNGSITLRIKPGV